MRHALLIGDDRAAATQLTTLLHAAGFARVTHAYSAEDAWAAAARKPDMVVVLPAWAAPADAGATRGITRKTDGPPRAAPAHWAHRACCLGLASAQDPL